MQQIYETIFDFYGTINQEGILNDLNGTIPKENQVDLKNFKGRKLTDLSFFNNDSFSETILKSVLLNSESNKQTRINLKLPISENKSKSYELTFIPLNENGVFSEKIFFGVVDITSKENEINFYKQRSEHFLFAAENAGVGLWFWDLKKDEIFSTPKCNELFELEPYEIFEMDDFFNAVHPDDVDRVEAELRKSHDNGEEYNTEYRVIHSDGNIHWVASRGKTFFDGNNEPLSMMGSVREITDQKMASEELATIYEREKKARDEAVQANKAKDFFLAVVSHELRSPLNTILGWTKILLSKEVDDKTRLNALETIERSAKSQSKLIDDLVDSARVTSGKLKLEMRSVNLYQILDNVYHAKKPETESKNIDLQFNCEAKKIEVFGDTVRLQQIFTNILSNAIKFTDENGLISIDVEKTPESVFVRIEDNGQGIAPDELPKIFDQFSQGTDSSGENKLGLGLGLSIAKILIQKHEGEIYAESPGRGQGSVFTIELPLLDEDSEMPDEVDKKSTLDEKVLMNSQIIVVEDDYDSRNVLKLFLEQLGARVESADSVRAALSILDQQVLTPDLIISDIAMPEEDGNSLIRKVRSSENKNLRRIPAIALSAFTAHENKEKALSSGFQIYHTKPFDPDLLIEEIKELINR